MVWRVANKAAGEQLQEFVVGRAHNDRKKLIKDILLVGEENLKSNTLKAFNKRLTAMIEGHGFEDENDDCPTVAFADSSSPDEASLNPVVL
jgi:hypothetical protein